MNRILAGLVAVGVISAPALATVVVEYRAGSGSWSQIGGTSSGFPVTIPWQSTAGSPQQYRVYATNPSTEDIGLVTFDLPSESLYQIMIGDHAAALDESNPLLPACRDFAGFRTSSTQVRFQMSIGRNVTGNIEGFDGGFLAIVRADIGGSLLSTVRHTRYLSQDLARFEVGGSVGMNANIQMLSGKLEVLNVAGDCLGNIKHRHPPPTSATS